MSRGLISYRRLVVSCFKMALDGSIIVEICDEHIRKNVSFKFIRLCIETLCWCPFSGTNMAAENQQKHLFFSFPTRA